MEERKTLKSNLYGNIINDIKYILNKVYGLAEICSLAIRTLPKNLELLNEIIRIEKDVGRSDRLLRNLKVKFPNEADKLLDKMIQYENIRRSALYYMKCVDIPNCKLAYIDPQAKSVVEDDVKLVLGATANPNFALMERRLSIDYFGMVSLEEFSDYVDEQNYAISQCPSLFSARTLLCIEPIEQKLLNFPILENPPDYSNLRGTDLASVFFTRYKVMGLASFAYPLFSEETIIPGEDGEGIPLDPKIVIDDDGLDLFIETHVSYVTSNTMDILSMDFETIMPYSTSQITSGASNFVYLFGLVLAVLLIIL